MVHTQSNIVSGVSLVELLITLTIAVILLAVAAPSYVDMVAANGATSVANDLLADLNYARSEAIARGYPVVVCKGTDTAVGSGCTSGNWEDGWKVFVDCNLQPHIIKVGGCADAANVAVLRVHPALSSGWTLRGNNNVSNHVTFKPDGIPKSFGTWVACFGGVLNVGDQTRSSAVTIDKPARVRILPYDTHGVPLNQASCTP